MFIKQGYYTNWSLTPESNKKEETRQTLRSVYRRTASPPQIRIDCWALKSLFHEAEIWLSQQSNTQIQIRELAINQAPNVSGTRDDLFYLMFKSVCNCNAKEILNHSIPKQQTLRDGRPVHCARSLQHVSACEHKIEQGA